MLSRRDFLKSLSVLSLYGIVFSNTKSYSGVIAGFPETEFLSPTKFFFKYDPNRTGSVSWGQY